MTRSLMCLLALLSMAGCASNGIQEVDFTPQDCVRWETLAQKGDAKAEFKTGVCYETSPTDDYAAAASWYRKSADQGYAYAQTNLGYLYQNGLGVPQDRAQALAWYRKAADQGEAHAEINMGNFYEVGDILPQDYGMALKYYQLAARQDNSEAQDDIGRLYEGGAGVSQDDAQALKWYRLSAQQGYVMGERHLGLLYEQDQDYSQALQWLRAAARKGDTFSQSYLVDLYQKGEGLPAGNAAIVAQFKAAAEAGDPEAQTYLGDLYYKGERGLEQDYSAAADWYGKAAAQGFARAEYNMGKLNVLGQGMPLSYFLARTWFAKAGDQGNGDAINKLGYLYENGYGVAQDFGQAVWLYRRGASYVDESKCNLLRLARLDLIRADAGELQDWEENAGGSEWCRNEMAWALATVIDKRRRDPVEALLTIRKVIDAGKAGWKDMDTLAAAYAANGDFVSAVKTEQQAISARSAAHDGEAGDAEDKGMRARLELFQSGQPYLAPL